MSNAIDGYVKGKLAGMNHCRALQHNPKAKPPANPYPTSNGLAFVEWDRGFSEGFAQGMAGAARKAA
jgi:hypothetical protein